MEEVRELVDGEYGKIIFGGVGGGSKKDKRNNITVDSEGFRHSINDQPAYIHFYSDGTKRSEIWYKHGIDHRLTGPSWISYNDNGEIYMKGYYIEGKEYTREDWEVEVNRIQMLNEI